MLSKTVGGNVFGRLVAPLSVAEFISHYWEKESLFVEGKSANKFDDIISVRDLDNFLSRTDIRHPSLRCVKDGKEFSLDEYSKELRLGAHNSHDLIDNEKLFVLFQQGATIVLQFLQHNIPSFGAFTNSIEEEFGCNVHGSCFITPPNAQGFTAHYDTYSFFVLQIHGEKNWNLYDRTVLPPIREDRDTENPWTPIPPKQKLKLKAGDFLYVPRGMFHDAETTSTTSIHMTLGFFTPNWIDVVKSALSELYNLEALRETPLSAVPGFGDPAFTRNEIDRIKKILVENLDLNRGLARLQEEYFARRVDTRVHRLADTIEAWQELKSRKFRVQPYLDYRHGEKAGKIELTFSDKSIKIPATLKDAIEFMAAGPFSAESLGSRFGEQSAKSLIKQLLLEGFLTIQR